MLIELLTKNYPGMRQWLAQRISAVYMAIYIVLFIALLLAQQPVSYIEWLAIFSPVWWRILTLVFFIALIMHAWLGVRDVLKDYIFNDRLRPYIQLLVDILLITYLVWAFWILWRV